MPEIKPPPGFEIIKPPAGFTLVDSPEATPQGRDFSHDPGQRSFLEEMLATLGSTVKGTVESGTPLGPLMHPKDTAGDIWKYLSGASPAEIIDLMTGGMAGGTAVGQMGKDIVEAGQAEATPGMTKIMSAPHGIGSLTPGGGMDPQAIEGLLQTIAGLVPILGPTVAHGTREIAGATSPEAAGHGVGEISGSLMALIAPARAKALKAKAMAANGITSEALAPRPVEAPTPVAPTVEAGGVGALSAEELSRAARKEQYWKITKGGEVTYQGAQPDPTKALRSGEAIVKTLPGQEPMVTQSQGLPDSEAVAAFKRTDAWKEVAAKQTAPAAARAAQPPAASAPVSPAKPGGPPALAPVPEPILTRGEATGSKARTVIERTLEGSIPGNKPFVPFREGQQTHLIDQMADTVVKNVSSYEGTDYELGKRLQLEKRAGRDAAMETARTMYGILNDQGPEVPVSTSSMKTFARSFKSELTKSAAVLGKAEYAATTRMLDAIIKGPDTVDFKTMHDIRSDLAKKGRKLSLEIPDKAGGFVKKMTSLAAESMETAAKGNPELLKGVKAADSYYRGVVDTFDRSIVKKFAKTAPEKLHLLLNDASIDDIGHIKKTITPRTWQATKARYLSSIIQNAVEDVAPSGEVGIEGPTRQLSPKKLDQGLRRLSPEKRSAIYTDAEWAGIEKVLDAAERIGGGPKGFGGFINRGLGAGVLFGSYKAAAGTPGPLAGVVGTAAAVRIAARLMAKPYTAEKMATLMKTLARENAKLPPDQRLSVMPNRPSQLLLQQAASLQQEMERARKEETGQ